MICIYVLLFKTEFTSTLSNKKSKTSKKKIKVQKGKEEIVSLVVPRGKNARARQLTNLFFNFWPVQAVLILKELLAS